MKKGAIFSAGVLVVMCLLPSLSPAQVSAANEKVIITQLQLGGSGSGTASQEYLEVVNDSVEDVDITGWCLYYASASSSTIGAKLSCMNTADPHTRVMLTAGGSLTAATQEFAATHPDIVTDISFNAGLSGTGGHVRLVDDAAVLVDLVGWGTAAYPEGSAVLSPPAGTTLQRKIVDNAYVDTNNNAQDFASAPLSEPVATGVYEAVDMCLNNDLFTGLQAAIPDGYELDEQGYCVAVPDVPSCEGLVITEILPNPSGADEGNEYIELQNSATEAINLDNCLLYVDGERQVLTGSVEAGGYQVIYDAALVNSTGGEVMLVIDGVEYAVLYPADLKDDIAWALLDGTWKTTDQATPGAQNKANKLVDNTDAGTGSESKLSPCPAGKERNPVTNRCRNIASADSIPRPCGPGQYRNAATNRCRKITSTSSTQKPCKSDQFRNPATNRCKKIAATTNVLKPCDEGEERNPETNRCRKITGVAGVASAINPAAVESTTQNYRVIGVALLLALAYALYEYRQGIAQKILLLHQKIFRR